jgi:hypothetical protein
MKARIRRILLSFAFPVNEEKDTGSAEKDIGGIRTKESEDGAIEIVGFDDGLRNCQIFKGTDDNKNQRHQKQNRGLIIADSSELFIESVPNLFSHVLYSLATKTALEKNKEVSATRARALSVIIWRMKKDPKLIALHSHASNNEIEILKSKTCSCFFCRQTYSARLVNDWINDARGVTAICPECGMDAVLGDAGGEADRQSLFKEMNLAYYGEDYMEKHPAAAKKYVVALPGRQNHP